MRTPPHERARVIVRGAVQGVGFRPFVYRLATELQLRGWVLNSAQGVFIEVEGARDTLRQFLFRLENGSDSPRHRDLRRLPARDCRSNQSAVPLSVHQLHELRAALFDHRSIAL